MAAIGYLKEGARDVIGGASGGLIAAYVLAGSDQRAVALAGIVFVVALAIFYGVLGELDRREIGEESDEEDTPDTDGGGGKTANWPLYRAS